MRRWWLLFFLLAPALPVMMGGADISGRWSGSIEVLDAGGGNSITTPVRAEFEQKANLVSGTIGRKEDERSESIRNGKIEGSRISFEVSSPETLSAMKFNLTLQGDRMEGEMKGMVDSGEIVGKVRLTKEGAHAGADAGTGGERSSR
jgi:hypothetical protein